MADLQTIQEEQVNTKELLKKTIQFLREVGKEWRLLLISLALGSLISLLMDLQEVKETEYVGEIQFNLETGGGGGGFGGLGGLAGAFGMNVGGATSNDLFSGGNFNLLVGSKALYEKALMKEVLINGKKTLFINYYKDSSDIARKEWGGDLFHKANTKAIKYRFNKKNPDQFTEEENTMIDAIYEKLSKKTELMSLDKTGTIMILSATTNNQKLTKIWLETLIKSIEEFYVEMKTRKTREIYDIQMTRLRELEGKLSSTDRQLANATFQSVNAVDPTAPMRTQQLNRNNNFISQQYYNQLAAVEQLKMSLINQTPLFTILQPVRLPLLQLKYTIGGNTSKGAMLGFVLCLVFIVIRNTFREINSEN